MSFDPDNLQVIQYPDPRLRQAAEPITVFDERLRALAANMLALMKAEKGVGLAGPQVAVPLRIFVMNPTGEEGDDRVIVNPELSEMEGAKDAEEGCLSIPDVNVTVRRALRCRLDAVDLDQRPISLEEEDLVARIWQHETDHLNGILIVDRMGPTDKIATKKKLRELEELYRAARR